MDITVLTNFKYALSSPIIRKEGLNEQLFYN